MVAGNLAVSTDGSRREEALSLVAGPGNWQQATLRFLGTDETLAWPCLGIARNRNRN